MIVKKVDNVDKGHGSNQNDHILARDLRGKRKHRRLAGDGVRRTTKLAKVLLTVSLYKIFKIYFRQINTKTTLFYSTQYVLYQRITYFEFDVFSVCLKHERLFFNHIPQLQIPILSLE